MRAKWLTTATAILVLMAGFSARAQNTLPDTEEFLPPPPTHWLAEGNTGNGAGPVTDEMLLGAADLRDSWLHYYGDYRGYRHSPVEELSPDTVGDLEFAWSMPTGTIGPFENSPVIHDGIMYVTTTFNRLFALDAASGHVIWRYDHQNPGDVRLCCGPMNRGVAISGDMVVMGTLDAELLAFDRLTGEILWQTVIDPYERGISVTSAPLIADSKVFIGVGGGEFGIRGFFDAYDLANGERLWRHFVIPTEGEFGVETWAGTSYETGGSPTWNTGTWDADTNTVFWATGNPGADWNGDNREGDNLFSDSLIAVDADTGERKWYFQFTPHDVWDYDGNTQVILVDVEHEGEQVRAIAHADRNGFYYLLNRETGALLVATQYLEQVDWATLDESGRPIVAEHAIPTEEGVNRICPGHAGGMNAAWTGAFNPNTGLYYVNGIESCEAIEKGLIIFVEGSMYLGGTFVPIDALDGSGYGNTNAIDVATGEVVWRHRDERGLISGILSTEGGLVFTGNQDGYVIALDASSGEQLWEARVGGVIRGQPVAFEIGGVPHVAFPAGGNNGVEYLTGGHTTMPDAGYLFVFRLAE